MNVLYAANYAIFAAFFTLFTLELGIAVMMLLGSYYKYYEQVKKFIMPLWQINGTFAVFYLVNLEATYPLLINIVGYAYIAPIMLAGIFLILRNAFISYITYSGTQFEERTYSRIYSLSTIMTYFLAFSVLTSAVSGYGIDVPTNSISLVGVLFNPFNILLFVGALLVSLFLATRLFEVKEHVQINFWAGPVAILLILFTINFYAHYLLSSLDGVLTLAFGWFILFVAAMLFGTAKRRTMRYVFLAAFFFAVLAFGIDQYPYVFGGQASVLNYITNSASGFWISLITIVGGALISVYLAYFVWIVYLKQKG